VFARDYGLGFLLVVGITSLLGGYLVFRPQDYKDEMANLGHLFGGFPRWALRILGVFLLAFAAIFAYLVLTGRAV
jgi:uncharacterized protein involved in exopolysaccharide biosynthesis